MGGADVSSSHPSPLVTPLARPEVFGDYVLSGRLGVGGSATVFLGTRRGEVQPVAVKRLHNHLLDNQEALRSFSREAKILSHLDHPGIARILDFGVVDDLPFLVTGYHQGIPMQHLLHRMGRTQRPFPIDVFRWVTDGVTNALRYAHTVVDENGAPLGLIHRDISPHNIYLTLEGQIVLLDFGMGRTTGTTVTQSGIIKGKVSYMSPEQALGADIDHRSDLFSLGVVCWEMLTRRRLFRKETDVLSLMAVTEGQIPDVRSFEATVPAPIAEFVQRSLQRSVGSRFQSADEMQRALQSATPEPLVPGDVRLAELMQIAFPELNRPVPRPNEAVINTMPDTSRTALDHRVEDFEIEVETNETQAQSNPVVRAWEDWDEEAGTLAEKVGGSLDAVVVSASSAAMDSPDETLRSPPPAAPVRPSLNAEPDQRTDVPSNAIESNLARAAGRDRLNDTRRISTAADGGRATRVPTNAIINSATDVPSEAIEYPGSEDEVGQLRSPLADTVSARGEEGFKDPASRLPSLQPLVATPAPPVGRRVVLSRTDSERFDSVMTAQDNEAISESSRLRDSDIGPSVHQSANSLDDTVRPGTDAVPPDASRTQLLEALPGATSKPSAGHKLTQGLVLATVVLLAFALGLWVRGLPIVQSWLSGS